MPSSNQVLTQNDHSRSFKVIRFGVNEEPQRGYIVQHNNCGFECEGSEDIASERSDKKLSYCWETVRRESMPRIAEMDVEMTT